MTKAYCDRCKKEITNDLIIHNFSIYESDSPKLIAADVCDDCYKAFESFMKMEDSLYHTNPSSNHGIERVIID